MAAPSYISTLTEQGRVSIPSKLRQELGLERGKRLLWEQVGEHELRVTVLPNEQPRSAMAMLGFARSFRLTRESQDWIEELREDS